MGLENRESGKTESKESDNSGQIRDVKMGCGYRKKRAVRFYENIILCSRPGALKCELGTDVRPEVSNQPEKAQNCNLCLNHLFLEGPLLKPIGKLGRVSTL